ADADDGGMPEAPALVNGDVGGPTPDVHERHTELFLVLGQDRLARSELLHDRLCDSHPRPVHTGDDVLRRALASGDDVNVDLETGPGHSHRRADSVLLVDHEILRQDVEDLASRGKRYSLGGIDRAADVFARDLPVLARYSNDPATVEPLDVGAG